MVKSILFFQLILFFLLAIISIFSFLFVPTISDHLWMISSVNKTISYWRFILNSILFLFNYYVGEWIFLNFIFFSIGFYKILVLRCFYRDIFWCIFLGGSVLFGFTLFYPLVVGNKILFFIDMYLLSFHRWAIFITFVILTIVFLSKDLLNLKGLSKKFLQGHLLGALFFKFLSEMKNIYKKYRQKREEISQKQQQTEDNKKTTLDQNIIDEGPPDISKIISEKESRDNDLPPQNLSLILDYSSEGQKDLLSCLRRGNLIGHSHYDLTFENEYFAKIIHRLEAKFLEFKLNGRIVNVLKGPVVDTFELELGAGVKISKVTSISEDLTLALKGVPLRIVYPMEGKTTVGIEIPRNPREIIYLDEILCSLKFEKNDGKLPLIFGKNTFGEAVIKDLALMPHLLVAGTTGSGKSVFINILLVSLLVRRPPQRMKLILIDPKQLELAIYEGIPHLVMPVITENSKALKALEWTCREMERRYSILKEVGVRSIDAFNNKLDTISTELLNKVKKYFVGFEKEGIYLSYIVVIIDEFADLISGKSGKDIENCICRLAAKARACGIHLILATQRPSVDVVTGLIKSNFPTRVSFKVSSGIDSRTILNSLGAEKLLGQGDMLFRSGAEVVRFHSAYIEGHEIEQLVAKLIENEKTVYDHKAIEFIDESEHENGADQVNNIPTRLSQDQLYQEAKNIVVEHKKASISLLQRRLKIGYNRAADLVDRLEEGGIIGPATQGGKTRSVYQVVE